LELETFYHEIVSLLAPLRVSQGQTSYKGIGS